MSHSSICPGCNKDVSLVRLVNLIYTFEDDGKNHFVETAWHKQCFVGQESPVHHQEALDCLELCRRIWGEGWRENLGLIREESSAYSG